MTETGRRYVDLSHEIVDGMTTHPGIPAPTISIFLSYEESAARYAPGTTFQIGRIDMVANTGTYIDTPAHRFEGRGDTAGLALDAIADLPGVVVDCRGGASRSASADRAIGPAAFDGFDLAGLAVLIRTDWDRHWGTPEYLIGHPFLSRAAAERLVAAGVAAVGIDSLNVDSLEDASRPAHTAILGAGVPLIEHLTGLGGLPTDGFRVFAVPPRVRGMATFPVRTFAIVEEG
ncbi:MAG: cyclase family protein [Thermoplasmata archaeon]|nr:cyclase family protein [Thermoplasmata archaeon]